MCFFGSRSQPSPAAAPLTGTIAPPAATATPAPKPAPLPSPVPTESAPMKTQQERRKRIAAVRYGILSTIKTSPLGIVGAGADLTGGRGKKTFGS